MLYTVSMLRNEEKYQNARDFRKRGFTYSEISKLVGVSRSTLSLWFANQPFSKKVRVDNEKKAQKDNLRRLSVLNKYRNHERQRHYEEAIKAAVVEYRHYKLSPLFMAGLMLYAGEGDNSDGRLIRMANSKPALHQIFIKFATAFLGVSPKDIRFWLLLYPDLSENDCKKVWMKAVGLPEGQFYKTQVIQGKSRKRTLHIGVGNTIIGSAYLKRKLMKWIELASKELSK